MDEQSLKELAAQLRQPDGDNGIKVAKNMEQNNAFMISAAIDSLQLKAGDRLLEAGFASGNHVGYALTKAADIRYTGIDISALMREEALSNNADWVENKQAVFLVTDGKTVPFKNNSFNIFFTVNTIYFWEHPAAYAAEILRVLEKDGHGCVTFAERSFMKQLPFTQFGFTLYSRQEVEQLLLSAGAIAVESKIYQEQITSNTGQLVDRTFVITSFRK